MKIKTALKHCLNYLLKPFGYTVARQKELIDFYLHKYTSYEEYRDVQIFHNKRKINNVWADDRTLERVCEIVLSEFAQADKLHGICHGTRNGFEQSCLRRLSTKLEVIGTDISDTAGDYENSVQWDFHDIKDEWVGTQNFVYTNSLDQSWQPHIAVQTWLSQLKSDGILIIEHTEDHGPKGSSEMDPFGVRPTVMPYILSMWFGSQISISHSVERKSNMDNEAWLFVIRKNVYEVTYIDSL